MDKVSLLLLSPNMGAHQTKKLRKGFLQTGCVSDLRVLSFSRPIEAKPDFPCEDLGTIHPRSYLSRLKRWWGAFWRIRSAMKTADVAFAFIMDCVFLAVLAKLSLPRGKCRLVYNIRDVHPLCVKRGVVGVLLRTIDRFLCRNADLVVVTSPAYISGYIEAILGLKNVNWLAIENKVPPELVATSCDYSAPPVSQKLCIGYFGMMSYPNSWQIIREASTHGLSFYLRGHNYLGESFERELSNSPYVEYGGAYKNPEDIAAMYSKIDISWAVNANSFTKGTNDEWAMCNRFYEALYFKKGLIVQQGSAHEEFVRSHDIGLVVDARDIAQTVKALVAITPEMTARWQRNIETIPENVYILGTNDYRAVFTSLGFAVSR